MPYVVTCPECSKRLKTPNPVPAGRAVTCPSCQHAFTTTKAAPELADTGAALSRPPVPPRPPVLPPPSPAKKAKQEELAEAEIVDDDEDDRPRAKKKRRDDEEDRPRDKKRRDDDEEVDDEPVPRRKKAKKTSAKKKRRRVLLLAIGLPLLLLLLVGGGFLVSSLLGGGAPSDMLAWAPSKTSAVRGIKFTKFDGNPALRKSANQEIPWANGLKIPLQSIDEVLIAAGDSIVFVIRSNSKLDAASLAQAAKATEMTANGKKYYRGDAGTFHVPSDFLLVYCAVESPIIDLLKKDAKVTVSADLRKYNGKAAGDVWEARTSYGNPLGDIGFGFSAPKGAYGGRRIVGNQVAYSYTFVFEDSAAAQRQEPQLKIDVMLFKTNSRRGMAYESFDYSRSGSKITITATGPIENDNYGFFGES